MVDGPPTPPEASSPGQKKREKKDCSWCKWMKAGGCRQEFEAWDDCVSDVSEGGGNSEAQVAACSGLVSHAAVCTVTILEACSAARSCVHGVNVSVVRLVVHRQSCKTKKNHVVLRPADTPLLCCPQAKALWECMEQHRAYYEPQLESMKPSS